MSEIELKARELLAEVHVKAGWPGCAKEILLGEERFDILHDLAIAAVVAALAPQWQPIESAPKDGTFYLATNGNAQRVENCPDGHLPGIWTRIDGDWCGVALGDDSTHWQPLPAPPEAEG